MMNLKGQVCLITGGTRGIGAAAALRLAQEGATIALAARHEDAEARKTRSQIEGAGVRCEMFAADFGQPQECQRCAAQVQDMLGTIGVLVHSAGGPVNGRLFEITPEIWHEAFNVHLHSAFYLCRSILPAMKQKKEGAVILVSSAAGLRALGTNIAYQAVKGALPQLTRALARELAEDNVRVNCVAPGVIRTRFHENMPPEQKRLNLEQRIPLRREGTADQVATLILELIKNDYITGETMSVDGGLTMRMA